MIPVFVLFFFLDSVPYNHAITALVFCLAALTDALDGYIARSRNLVTNLGKFLDPIADKVLVATAFVLMVANPLVFGVFGVWGNIVGAICICVILGRELIISAFRQIAATAGIVLAAEKLGKYKTAFQDACVVVLLVSVDLSGNALKIVNGIGLGLFAIATMLTIVSGISYVWKNISVLKDTTKA